VEEKNLTLSELKRPMVKLIVTIAIIIIMNKIEKSAENYER
jgi:hypothetical protein